MKKVVVCLFVMLFLTMPSPIQSQGPDDTNKLSTSPLRLQTGIFDPLIDGAPVSAARAGETTSPYYIVQFEGPVQATWIEQLELLGADVLGYIPDNAHIARIQPNDVAKITDMYAVRWVGPYQPTYKVAPRLGQRLVANRLIDLNLLAFPGESLSELTTFLSKLGATISDTSESNLGISFRITVSTNNLADIVNHPAFAWIEPYTPITVSNAEAREIMNTEQVWQTDGLFGAGQIIAISDSGLSVDGNLNADFAGRLVQGFPPSEMNLQSGSCQNKTTLTDLNGHGTHVAGSVLGNGLNSGSIPESHEYANSHAGNAPEASMVFMAVGLTGGGSLECISTNGSFISLGYENGARISTNSWGGGADGEYDLLASIVDNYIWNHKDYLVHFAAGNSGPGAGTIGSPGSAKNILSVGASENNRPTRGSISDNPDSMASFSSRGPTADGRIKPDIVAPGTNILSVLGAQAQGLDAAPGETQYAFSSGTSMATPLTAGGSAIVREWLEKKRGNPNPSAALLKALMIHGAYQLPNVATPNADSGWGRVDLKNTLDGQYVIFDDHLQGLNTDNVINYTIDVVGANQKGVLIRNAPRQPRGQVAQTFGLIVQPPSETAENRTSSTHIDGLSFDAVPGFEQPSVRNRSARTGLSDGEEPPTSALAAFEGRTQNSSAFVESLVDGALDTQGVQINVVEGGDFEDPGWTNGAGDLWYLLGTTARTNNSDLVISGNHSTWILGLGGIASVWYPIKFPDIIDSQFDTRIDFTMRMFDFDRGDPELDPFFDLNDDEFCVTITDTAGFPLTGESCTDNNLGQGSGADVLRRLTLTDSGKAAVEGKAGYLVFYTLSDGIFPHMSTIIDDIRFDIDYPQATLTSSPSSGPPGTTFFLQGSNNTPYSQITLCTPTCSQEPELYADAQGDFLTYLLSDSSTIPGIYTITSEDENGLTASVNIEVTSQTNPTLSVSPTSGPAGTRFTVSGADFLSSDSNIEIVVNDESLGLIGSDSNGNVTFDLTSSSNTIAGTYTIELTDSANRSATTSLEITEVPQGNPTMTVSPPSGVAGTNFEFTGTDFTPDALVTFVLDGQELGQAEADGSGGFVVTLSTETSAPAGTYILVAQEGVNAASAEFEITDSGDGGGDGETPSGSGLYITLVWTDPPAQTTAAKTLVNDLNLQVDGPGGRFFGNGGTSADTLNNVETIRLETPTAGTYTVQVIANSVNGTFGSQPYAIVATTNQSFGANTANANVVSQAEVSSGAESVISVTDNVQLTVPSGAVTDTTTLAFVAQNQPKHAANTNTRFGGIAFSIDASQNDVAIENFEFQKPVTLTINYNDAAIDSIKEDTLTLYTWNETQNLWEAVEESCPAGQQFASLNTVTNQIIVQNCHLSEFGLYGDTEIVYLPLVLR
ncbi:MAG: S8 family serine peptidase [Chloroflexota bacterium]